ncbi:hypothetical protein UB45_07685 [Terrabacter sp. 28]|nr:hypothetical protein UB45_07685 [Terrabacter sp. 28]
MMEPVLECQMCGTVLRTLTPSEAREVADRPYDFVLFCAACRGGMAEWSNVSESTLGDPHWSH